MTKKFSTHSYNYIQGWLKNEYHTNPEFKKKANDNTSFQYLKRKCIQRTTVFVLEALEIYFQNTIPNLA
jgi:hypothetical protein